MTSEETKNLPDVSHYDQVRVLVQDLKEPAWTRAHFALFILSAIDNGDMDWLVLLNRANLAHRSGNRAEYTMMLDVMKKEVNYKEEEI